MTAVRPGKAKDPVATSVPPDKAVTVPVPDTWTLTRGHPFGRAIVTTGGAIGIGNPGPVDSTARSSASGWEAGASPVRAADAARPTAGGAPGSTIGR